MSQFKTIIDTGYQLFQEIVELIAGENKKRLNDENKMDKQLIIGISPEKDLKFSRMMKFLNEAGLLYELTPVKHGKDREYQRFMPHVLFLIKNRAFNPGKGFDSRRALESLRRKSAKHPVRRSFDTLLNGGQINNIKLDLPPCSRCSAERVTEGQRFCHNCGAELIEKSRFESCMEIPIEELPISKRLKEIINKETSFKTVGDIITSPAPSGELQEGKGIGRIRSGKILDAVKKTVEEFLV